MVHRIKKEEERVAAEEAARKLKEEERQRKIDAGEEVSDEGMLFVLMWKNWP